MKGERPASEQQGTLTGSMNTGPIDITCRFKIIIAEKTLGKAEAEKPIPVGKPQSLF